MKKTVTFLLVCTLLCMPTAAADLSEYRYEEGAFSLLLPAGWVLFTPDVQDDDPNLGLLDTDGETMRQTMSDNNIVFNSICSDLSREVTVSWFQNTRSRVAFDYNILEPEALSEQARSMLDYEFDGEGAVPSYLSFDKYQNGQVLFLRFKGVITEGETTEAEFIEYSTVINGYACNISLHVYGRALTEEDAAMLQEIADSMVFDEVLEKTPDREITLTVMGIIIFMSLMIGSVVWSIVRYRKKMKLRETQ